MNKKHEILFTPMKIGSVEIKNRFVLEPMEGTNIIDSLMGCKFNDHVHDYYIERAKADIGLIIPGMILLRSMIGDKWVHENPKVFDKVKPLMDEIHSYGSKVFFQIGPGWGRAFTAMSAMKKINDNKVLKTLAKPLLNMDHLAVSASENPNRWLPSLIHREIREDEIQAYIDAFAKTARLCKDNGVDGVEVHAVHEGYLLDEFTHNYVNKRTDKYGGSFENRYRFAVEIVKAIKKECGEDYPVSIRYSVTSKTKGFDQGAVPGETDYVEVGRDLEEGMKAAKYLQDAGYDMLNADNGTYDAWYWAHPPVYMPLNCNLEESKAISPIVDIPVVCAGRMQADEAADAIREGKLTGIGIGRQFLADPEYIHKLAEDRLEDVLPCISCHNACLPVGMIPGEGVAMGGAHDQGHCALNPRTFNEAKYTIKKTSSPKNIAIIGGGIGGMTVAMLTKKMGHNVTIYEKTGELGGVFIAAAVPSFKEKDKELVNWYRHQMDKLHIDIKYNTEITDLNTLKADEIIIATGAAPRLLNIKGLSDSIEAIEYLRGYKEVGQKVAVIGGGLTGCEIAYQLALDGKEPVIIEMQDRILTTQGLCMANSTCLRDLLNYYKVPAYTNASAAAYENGCLIINTPSGEKKLPVDSVITSCGYIPGTSLIDAKTLKKAKNIHAVGDVSKVGNLKHVIWAAYDVAFGIK